VSQAICRCVSSTTRRVLLAAGLLAGSLAALASSAEASAGLPATKPAPSSLVIAKIASANTLRAAGVPITKIEDDGGNESPEAFSSQIRALAADGTLLTITLATYPTAAAAKSAYDAGTSDSSLTPLRGIGAQAASSTSEGFVRKGSQVLSVQATLSAADEQQLIQAKEQGQPIPQTLGAAEGKDVNGLLTGLAGRLSGAGAPTSENYLELPPGSADPCVDLSAASIRSIGLKALHEEEISSDTPPELECEYSSAAGTFDVYTITSAQAAKAVPSTTVHALIQRDYFGSGTGTGSGTSDSGPSMQSGAYTVQADIGPDTSVTLIDQDPSTKQEFGMAIDTAMTGGFTHPEDLCIKFIQPWAKELMHKYDHPHIDGPRSETGFNESPYLPDFVQELTTYCNDAAARGGGYVAPPEPKN
jgi:hypothetical protein